MNVIRKKITSDLTDTKNNHNRYNTTTITQPLSVTAIERNNVTVVLSIEEIYQRQRV